MWAQVSHIELRESAIEMTAKTSDKNDERYKALGFESTFDGSSGGIRLSWSAFKAVTGSDEVRSMDRAGLGLG